MFPRAVALLCEIPTPLTNKKDRIDYFNPINFSVGLNSYDSHDLKLESRGSNCTFEIMKINQIISKYMYIHSHMLWINHAEAVQCIFVLLVLTEIFFLKLL